MKKPISPLQVYMLFSQMLYSTLIGFFIGPLVRHARYSFWISILVGCLLGLGSAYFAVRLARKRPDQSLAQYGAAILSKWVHFPLFSFALFINLYSSAFIMRMFEDFVVEIYLPGTPAWAVGAIFGLCIAYAVRSGAATLFLSSQGIFFFSILAALTFPLFTLKEMNWDMAVAFVTSYHLPGIWNGSLMVAGLFAEMSFIVYFFPEMSSPGKSMKMLFWATITALAISLGSAFSIILLFGPDLTVHLTYPTLEMIRYVRTGVFLENLDPLLIVFWMYSLFLKISLFMLTVILGFTQMLGLKDHKPFSFLFVFTMLVMSLYMFRTSTAISQVTNHSGTSFLLFTCLLPVLYLLVNWLRSLGKKKHSGQPPEPAPAPAPGP